MAMYVPWSETLSSARPLTVNPLFPLVLTQALLSGSHTATATVHILIRHSSFQEKLAFPLCTLSPGGLESCPLYVFLTHGNTYEFKVSGEGDVKLVGTSLSGNGGPVAFEDEKNSTTNLNHRLDTSKPPKAKAPLSYLWISERVLGKGPKILPGDMVNVRFIARIGSETGPVYDSNVRGMPCTLTIGEKGVIKGLLQGLTGMRPGGERRLYVPASLTYGVKGKAAIAKGSHLVIDYLPKHLESPWQPPESSSKLPEGDWVSGSGAAHSEKVVPTVDDPNDRADHHISESMTENIAVDELTSAQDELHCPERCGATQTNGMPAKETAPPQSSKNLNNTERYKFSTRSCAPWNLFGQEYAKTHVNATKQEVQIAFDALDNEAKQSWLDCCKAKLDNRRAEKALKP
ncbi:hypothetical protein NLJ89_g8251 [Agrocybe chaxingu]|uniref:peptidylprolyl isomerase n=1 Tax=Agrocybe chaxingu TaxID=84603 RepID=A0A9W8JXT0_9AGAR|nr:hypothetical protein NLJ89_g8251 [Agrocybe chaxingu]